MEIFRLFGSVLVDNAEANKSIDSTGQKADGVGSKLSSMVGTAAKWGAGIAAGAAAAAGGMFALASKVSDAASEINDMSVRTGLSTKTLQELKFATGQAGVNFESITGAVGRLTKTMGDAGEGSKAAEEAFKKLGLSTVDSEGNMRKMDEMFPEVIKGLAGMQNETERNALAMDFFGKGALELAPLLSAGGDGIDAFAKQAHDLGLVLSEDAINAGDQFGDSLDAIKSALGGVVAQVGVGLMPAFQSVMDWGMAHMPQIQATMAGGFDAVGSAIRFVTDDVIPPVVTAFQFVRENWDVIGPALAAMALVVIVPAFVAWAAAAWASATATIAAASATILALLPVIAPVLLVGAAVAALALIWKTWGDDIQRITGEAVEWITSRFDAFMTALSDTWQAIKDTAVAVWDSIKAWFAEWWETLLVVFTGPIGVLILMIVKNWDDILAFTTEKWNAIKQFFADIWNGITGVFGPPIEAIATLISATWTAITNATETAWNGIKGFFSGIWTGIKSSFTGAFTDMVESAGNFGRRIMEALKNAIGSVKIPVPTFSLNWKEGPLGVNIPDFDFGVSMKALSGLIPGLAEGGRTLTDGSVLVGELGPELLHLPRGAQVEPLETRSDDRPIELFLTIQSVLNGQIVAEEVLREIIPSIRQVVRQS